MNTAEKFWKEIAGSLTSNFGNLPPKEWNKAKIEAFLRDFKKKLESICQENPQKAALCKLHPVNGSKIQSPSLTYSSFRRIFITGGSSGNRTTREMFAIYLGYDSAHDFMAKRGIIEEPRVQTPEPLEEASSKSPRRRWITIATILIIIFLLLLGKCACSHSGESKLMFVKNDQGIFLINLDNHRSYQIVKDRDHVVGFDFDPNTRMLFWADVEDHFKCVSSARVNRKFTGIEEGTLNSRLTRKMGFPTGIAIDVKESAIYCADYDRSLIAKYDYSGKLLSDTVVKNMKGKPSSVELDTKRNILYWTDLVNNRIGRVFLETGQVEPDFINPAGDFPDGLSLDTINNKIFWATNQGEQIGWSSLAAPKPNLIHVKHTPSAVEIDATQGKLYYTRWNEGDIGEIQLGKKNIVYNTKPNSVFSANGTSPGVLKLFYIKK